VFAFARTGAGPRGNFSKVSDPGIAITCVPRLIATLTPDGSAPPLGRSVWTDTRVELPGPAFGRAYRDVFTGAIVEPERDEGSLSVAVATLLDRFPVALLVPCSI
jgi:maltooligosyltrehalose synthase